MSLGGGSDEPLSFLPSSVLGGGSDSAAAYIPSSVLGGGSDGPVDVIPSSVLGSGSDAPVDFFATVASPSEEEALALTSEIAGPPPEQALLVASQIAGPVLEENLLVIPSIDPDDIIPADFSLRRGYEGPQVIIEWGASTDPSLITSIRLVRRRYGFPQNENDGVVVFSGPPGAQIIADLDVASCVCYFYKLFVIDIIGRVVTSTFVQDDVLVLATGYYGPRMFELLPHIYVVDDKGQNEPEDIRQVLLEGPGDTPEVYNFDEDGTVRRGPLQRMLRLWGPMLDEAKGLVDCFPTQLDVDDSCINELRGLAALLGLGLNEELAPEKMRNEVREQANFLKLKGTIPGIEARFRSVSGLTPVVHEQCNDILISNDPERTSPGFTIGEIANIGGPDDELWYSVGYPDGAPFWLWFTVFAEIPDGMGLTFPIVRKWCLSIEEASPTCHKGTLVIETLAAVDAIPVPFTDDFLDETDDADAMPVPFSETPTDTATADASYWMIINDVADLFNEDNYQAVFATINVP